MKQKKKKVVCVNKWSLRFKKYKSFVFIVFIYTELQGDKRNVFLRDINNTNMRALKWDTFWMDNK